MVLHFISEDSKKDSDGATLKFQLKKTKRPDKGVSALSLGGLII